ncbi:MAG: hypothetical protein LUH22_05025 [Bacteroides sp.]|nr:hypothetical protein [Bacteroides sp.]
MIDLARHIELLLLENDCVILPGFGGFVTHNASARWCKEERVFFASVSDDWVQPTIKNE